jgi:hypothetical protein
MTPLATAEAAMPAAATDSIEAIIAAGAALLVREPWRADRIIRGAQYMTSRELELTCNRFLAHRPGDLNRTLALLQLRRATDSPLWGPAWAAYKESER